MKKKIWPVLGSLRAGENDRQKSKPAITTSMSTATASVTSKWITTFHPQKSPKLRVICFPPGGANATMFFPWSTYIQQQQPQSTNIEICAVQLPGRASRLEEEPMTDVSSIVTSFFEKCLPFLKEAPFVLFGHSFGALLAYELTARIQQHNSKAASKLPLVALFLSGQHSAHLVSLEPQYHMLRDEDFIQVIHRYGGTSQSILEDTSLMELLLPRIRADFKALETYDRQSAKSAVEVPVFIYGGMQDNENCAKNRLEAWNELTTHKNSKLRMFPGGHFYFQTHEEIVLDTLLDDLHSLVK